MRDVFKRALEAIGRSLPATASRRQELRLMHASRAHAERPASLSSCVQEAEAIAAREWLARKQSA